MNAITERPRVGAVCDNGDTTKSGPDDSCELSFVPGLTPNETGSW